MKFDGHPSKITVPKNGHLKLIAILLLLVFRSAPVNREPVEVTNGGVFQRVFPRELSKGVVGHSRKFTSKHVEQW